MRAALEAVCYQTRDLMHGDGRGRRAADRAARRRRHGANDWLMQFLADILDVPVERPAVTETTALGAALLAGLAAGMFSSTDEVAQNWQSDRVFRPMMKDDLRDQLYAGWRAAVKRVQS